MTGEKSRIPQMRRLGGRLLSGARSMGDKTSRALGNSLLSGMNTEVGDVRLPAVRASGLIIRSKFANGFSIGANPYRITAAPLGVSSGGGNGKNLDTLFKSEALTTLRGNSATKSRSQAPGVFAGKEGDISGLFV